MQVISEKQKKFCRSLGLSLAKKVQQYDLQGDFVREFKSTQEASRILKISQGNISVCCRGKRKTAGGYVWKYK